MLGLKVTLERKNIPQNLPLNELNYPLQTQTIYISEKKT